MSMKEKVIVALDLEGFDNIVALVDSLNDAVWFKVGAVNFTAYGVRLIDELKKRGKKVFLDLKYHDIPNTVKGAVASACRLGVDMITLHACGGVEMMRAAVEARESSPGVKPVILAVTVLTSMDDKSIREYMLIDSGVEDAVVRFAENAKKAGVDGIVASVKEVSLLRERFGGDLKLVTPGIRPRWALKGDQKRVTTPADAVKMGVDFIVVGRPIYGSSDPKEAFEKIVKEMEDVC